MSSSFYALSRGYRAPKSGLSCPKVGVIVPPIFLLYSTTQVLSTAYKDLISLCMPNKIYKIDSVPARLPATRRLLEYLAFAIFLDTTTPAERALCRVTTSRTSRGVKENRKGKIF